MTKSFFAILSVGALALTACADNGADQAEGADAGSSTEATAAAEAACTQENMQEKATALASKMQELASDPAKMQELSAEMMEIQKKVQDSGSDGSYSLQDACDAYDELLKL